MLIYECLKLVVRLTVQISTTCYYHLEVIAAIITQPKTIYIANPFNDNI